MLNQKEALIVAVVTSISLFIASVVLTLTYQGIHTKPKKEIHMAKYGKNLSKARSANIIASRAPGRSAGIAPTADKNKTKPKKVDKTLQEATEYYYKHSKFKNDAQRNAYKKDIAKRQAARKNKK